MAPDLTQTLTRGEAAEKIGAVLGLMDVRGPMAMPSRWRGR